ncbi:MAG: replication initiation factor domain-containing protein [Sulfolobaceae archaeon]
MENTVIIDWLTFRLEDISLNQVYAFLGINKEYFTRTQGFWGYDYADSYDGIKILFKQINFINNDYDQIQNRIIVNMSGSGCRTYEDISSYEWSYLLYQLIEIKAKITRLDIACDTEKLPLKKIHKLTYKFINNDKSNIVTNFQWCDINHSTKGLSLYFGSPKSNIRIRIYDKGAERGFEPYIRTRVEIQLRDDNAQYAVEHIINSHVSEAFYGILNNNLRFVNNDNENSSRKSNKKWWSVFLDHTRKLKTFRKLGREYNIQRVENNLKYHFGSNIKTYLIIKNQEELELLIQDVKLNKKQKDLIDLYKNK